MRKQILTLLLIVCSIIVNAQVKKLDKRPIAKRDSILLKLAKQTILYYAPEYYEINRPPIIERKVAPIGNEDAGRVWFTVKYFYKKEFYDKFPDPKQENFLAKVYIWEDTGLVSGITVENRGISDLDKKSKSRSTNGKQRLMIIKNSWMPVEVDNKTKIVKK